MFLYEDTSAGVSCYVSLLSVYIRNAVNVPLARDRVALLLDQDSPFLELGAFTGFGNEDSTPCGNLIAGIGNVCGRICLLMSHIPTQSGGAWNEMTGMKQQNIYSQYNC